MSDDGLTKADPGDHPEGSSDTLADTRSEVTGEPGDAVTAETAETSDGTSAPDEAEKGGYWSRYGGRDLLELFVLTGFAIAQPLLSATGKAPEFFSYRRLSSMSMIEYILLVVFAPTLVLWGVERVVALVSRTAERWLHFGFMAALLTAIVIEVGKGRGVPYGIVLGLLAIAAGIGLTVLIVRSATMRLYLRYASPAPLVFALLFVTTSPSGAIVRQAVGGSGPAQVAVSVPAAGEAGGGSSTSATAPTPASQSSIQMAPAGVKTAAHPPVVMIFFDEFPLRSLLKPDGTVNAALFPNFAWLSKNTNWMRNATGVSGFTPYAVPAMLRGKFPAKALPPVYSSYKDNLLAELSGTYNVSAMETITALCPPSMCKTSTKVVQKTGLEPTLSDSAKELRKLISPWKDKSDPTTEFADSGTADVTDTAAASSSTDKAASKCTTTTCLFPHLADDQPSRVATFIKTLTPPPAKTKPTFKFLHVLLPHGPWRYNESGRPYPYPPAVGPGHADNGGWVKSAWPVQVNLAREMMQLSYADKLLGGVLTKLRAEKLMDKTLLVVTADHGEGFVPGDQARTLDAATAADLAWVPMFLKMPGQVKGKLDQRNWTHVDLTATLADALHVKLPQKLDGQSALKAPRTTTVKYWFNTPGKRLVIPDPVGAYQKVIKGYGGVLGQRQERC